MKIPAFSIQCYRESLCRSLHGYGCSCDSGFTFKRLWEFEQLEEVKELANSSQMSNCLLKKKCC